MTYPQKVSLMRHLKGFLFVVLTLLGILACYAFRSSDMWLTVCATTAVVVYITSHTLHRALCTHVRLHGTHADAVAHIKSNPKRHIAIYYTQPLEKTLTSQIHKSFPNSALTCVWVRTDQDDDAKQFLQQTNTAQPALVTYDTITAITDPNRLVTAHKRYTTRNQNPSRRIIGLDELDYIEVGQCIYDAAQTNDNSTSEALPHEDDMEFAADIVAALADPPTHDTTDDH